jgi:hypothetical protein
VGTGGRVDAVTLERCGRRRDREGKKREGGKVGVPSVGERELIGGPQHSVGRAVPLTGGAGLSADVRGPAREESGVAEPR